MLKAILRRVFKAVSTLQQWAGTDFKSERTTQPPRNELTMRGEQPTRTVGPKRYQLINLWDHLAFKEGSQAHHITKVLDHEEWVSMEEILRRVNELFGITYQNERSLYPYLKTLVDAGLLEANMVGGKMKWRKKNLIISVREEDEEVAQKPMLQPL